MSKLADPHVCPDCRAALDPSGTCTGCGLRLVGPTASELWGHMVEADRLVEQLRAAPVAAPVTAPLPTAPPTPPLPEAHPTPASLPSMSIPVVLLALGGLCLLVAATVFVAVAWSSLGLAAKATILLAVTGLVAAGAVAVTRRDLRFGAETLWLLVAAMVGLDLGSAYGADLLGLGRLSDRDAVGLIGAVLLGIAVGVGAWATTTPLRRLHGLVAVAAIGTVLLAGAEAWTNDADNPFAVAVSVPLLVALGLAVDRLTAGHLRTTALVVASGGLVSWLGLIGYGVDRMSATATDHQWWSELAGWPLLVAAVFAAALAVVRRAAEWIRMVAAGGGLVAATLFAVGPSTGPTADLLAWAGVSALIAVVAAAAPRVWARPAAALTALGLLVWSGMALARPLVVIAKLPTTASADRQHLGLHLPELLGGPAAWTAVVSVLVVGATITGLIRHLPSPESRDAAGRTLIALGPGALALGASSTLLETEPTLVVALVAWSATLAITGAMAATVRHHTVALAASLVFSTYLLAVGLRLVAPSHLLAALLGTGVALALAAFYARVQLGRLAGHLAPGLAAATVALAGFAVVHWSYLADGRADAAGLCLVAVAAVALLVAKPGGRNPVSRLAIEAIAVASGIVAIAIPDDATVVAMVLTILGSAVAIVAVLNEDRSDAAWVSVLALGVATIVRVAEDVQAPEAYTLPAAALLLAAGWWRLTHDGRADSVRALSSGLTLALLPSLLLALDEPVSVRGALVAAGGLVALAVGVARHWSAPFVAGALTTGVLAVRHLGPVVEGLPRWISLGSVGVILLVIGVTWEQRRRDVDATSRYLAALR